MPRGPKTCPAATPGACPEASHPTRLPVPISSRDTTGDALTGGERGGRCHTQGGSVPCPPAPPHAVLQECAQVPFLQSLPALTGLSTARNVTETSPGLRNRWLLVWLPHAQGDAVPSPPLAKRWRGAGAESSLVLGAERGSACCRVWLPSLQLQGELKKARFGFAVS